MKKRYILYMVTFLGLLLWSASNAVAKDKSNVIQQTSDPGIILFGLVVFALAILAFWLLKNSSKLKFMDQAEPDGAEWINKHLNDLETHQLDKLINRRYPVKNEANNLKTNKKIML